MKVVRITAALVVVIVGAGWLIALSPAAVGYGLAISSAFGYCRWLERQGEPATDPDGGVEISTHPQHVCVECCATDVSAEPSHAERPRRRAA
jgi:hypothetical protein